MDEEYGGYNYTGLTDQYFLEDEIVNEGKESERKTYYIYDKVGNVLTVTDPRGKTSINEYDDLYRLISVTSPDGSVIEYEYDRVGNKVREIERPDQDNPGKTNISRDYYNPYDQLIKVDEPGITGDTEYNYDPEGKLIRKKAANGLETIYRASIPCGNRGVNKGPGNTEVSIKNDIFGKPRVDSALKMDKYHAFNDIVDNYVGTATKFNINNGTLYQLEGSLNGVPGRFEWIIQDGYNTHRMVVPGGTVNGVPIKP